MYESQEVADKLLWAQQQPWYDLTHKDVGYAAYFFKIAHYEMEHGVNIGYNLADAMRKHAEFVDGYYNTDITFSEPYVVGPYKSGSDECICYTILAFPMKKLGWFDKAVKIENMEVPTQVFNDTLYGDTSRSVAQPITQEMIDRGLQLVIEEGGKPNVMCVPQAFFGIDWAKGCAPCECGSKKCGFSGHSDWCPAKGND